MDTIYDHNPGAVRLFKQDVINLLEQALHTADERYVRQARVFQSTHIGLREEIKRVKENESDMILVTNEALYDMLMQQ